MIKTNNTKKKNWKIKNNNKNNSNIYTREK